MSKRSAKLYNREVILNSNTLTAARERRANRERRGPLGVDRAALFAGYSASKHAARALTDSVREEVRSSAITVTGAHPGS